MSQIPKADSHAGNLSKTQKEGKNFGADFVFNNDPKDKPKQNSRIKNNKEMRKLFNKIAKYDEAKWFSEASSDDLNTLVYNLFLKEYLEHKLSDVDESHGLDDDFDRLLIRLDKVDKKIDTARKNLGLSVNAKLRLANDLAKLYVEQQKINGQSQAEEDTALDDMLEESRGM